MVAVTSGTSQPWATLRSARVRTALGDLRRSETDRVVAGVCGGIAEAIHVDPTVVRLVFALLALAGGSGIVLYWAAWLFIPSADGTRRRGARPGSLALLVAAGLLGLGALGLPAFVLGAAALAAVGLALIWGRREWTRGQAPAPLPTVLGVVLVAAGAVLLLGSDDSVGGTPGRLVTPGAVAAGLLMVVGPWLWRLAVERDAEKTERIRSEERAEMAARVHDSVLQTLALIQRHADEPKRVATLARRQERELRSVLYDATEAGPDESFRGAISAAAAEIEELHGVRVELATAGDVPLDEGARAVVLAAREAMANAAKFSECDEISVYAETSDDRISVFVRDRGAGFDRESVPPERRGLADSIEARMERHGGAAVITSAPGQGTEVELTLPRNSG
jgi:signal transduction histidine kinase